MTRAPLAQGTCSLTFTRRKTFYALLSLILRHPNILRLPHICFILPIPQRHLTLSDAGLHIVWRGSFASLLTSIYAAVPTCLASLERDLLLLWMVCDALLPDLAGFLGRRLVEILRKNKLTALVFKLLGLIIALFRPKRRLLRERSYCMGFCDNFLVQRCNRVFLRKGVLTLVIVYQGCD